MTGGILGRFENVRVKKSAKKTVTCDAGDQAGVEVRQVPNQKAGC